MTKSMLAYGALSGAIVIASIILGMQMSNGDGPGASVWLGYLIMLIALSLIFLAIKRHRDREGGGVISFLTALRLGLGVSAVAGIVYVIGWEAHLAATDYAFIEVYTSKAIESKKAAGVSGEALEAVIRNMEALKERYKNPVFRLPMTFMEIFPVGAIVSLVSAALLRNSRFLPARGA